MLHSLGHQAGPFDGEQVCSGVLAMHQMQLPLAHRDIKPHNVLIRRHSPETVSSSGSSTSRGAAHQEDASSFSAETQPLRAADAGGSSRYHAVLMVRVNTVFMANSGLPVTKTA